MHIYAPGGGLYPSVPILYLHLFLSSQILDSCFRSESASCVILYIAMDSKERM